jgi:hypothetical protein
MNIVVTEIFECPFIGKQDSGCDTCGPYDVCNIREGADCTPTGDCPVVKDGIISVQYKGRLR